MPRSGVLTSLVPLASTVTFTAGQGRPVTVKSAVSATVTEPATVNTVVSTKLAERRLSHAVRNDDFPGRLTEKQPSTPSACSVRPPGHMCH